jgi:hypothetical protein
MYTTDYDGGAALFRFTHDTIAGPAIAGVNTYPDYVA